MSWRKVTIFFIIPQAMIRLCAICLFCVSPLVLLGCGAESPWDLSMREVQSAIERGDYDYAEGVLNEALPRAEIWGESDQRLALVLHYLGEVYRRQNKLAKAEPYFWRALPIWARSVGAEHPKMATSLTGLARVYQAKHEYRKAEPLMKQALTIREKAFGLDHPNILPSLKDYASLLKLMNRNEEAKKLNARRRIIAAQ